MVTKKVMRLSIPRAFLAWIVAEAGKLRMSISEYMLVLFLSPKRDLDSPGMSR